MKEILVSEVQVGDELIFEGEDWVVAVVAPGDHRGVEGRRKIRLRNLDTKSINRARFLNCGPEEKLHLLRSKAEAEEARAKYRSVMGSGDDVRRQNAYESHIGL